MAAAFAATVLVTAMKFSPVASRSSSRAGGINLEQPYRHLLLHQDTIGLPTMYQQQQPPVCLRTKVTGTPPFGDMVMPTVTSNGLVINCGDN